MRLAVVTYLSYTTNKKIGHLVVVPSILAMLILIPGASGNLGLHLVRSALKRGHQVRALGRDLSKIPSDLYPQLESFVTTKSFDDKAGLDAGCKGADAIIVGYNGDPVLVLDAQLALLRAAERANIKRFHAMSWNLDWEHLPMGIVDSYNPFISFHYQAKHTSSIKPVYVFSGVLAMTLFGVPGAGAMEGESAVWSRGARGERFLKVIGKGQTNISWSVESDVADFSVALVTSNDGEKGGFYRFCSDEFTLEGLAATYTEVRGAECNVEYVMDLETCKQIVKKAKDEAESLGEVYLRWKSYLGLTYGIITEEGTHNPRPVDGTKFSDVPRTSLADYVKRNEWV